MTWGLVRVALRVLRLCAASIGRWASAAGAQTEQNQSPSGTSSRGGWAQYVWQPWLQPAYKPPCRLKRSKLWCTCEAGVTLWQAYSNCLQLMLLQSRNLDRMLTCTASSIAEQFWKDVQSLMMHGRSVKCLLSQIRMLSSSCPSPHSIHTKVSSGSSKASSSGRVTWLKAHLSDGLNGGMMKPCKRASEQKVGDKGQFSFCWAEVFVHLNWTKPYAERWSYWPDLFQQWGTA